MVASVTRTMSETRELSPEKQATLRKLEGIIRKGQTAFLSMSKAILQIEEEELYLPHKNVGANCAFKWDMKDYEVSRCMSAARVILNLESAEVPKLPSNESQARELQHLEKDDQVTVWNAVLAQVKRGERITARVIKRVIAELFPGEAKAAEEPQQQDAEVLPIDFRPILEGLQVLDAAIPRNKITIKERDALREQLKAAEELLARIKKQIG